MRAQPVSIDRLGGDPVELSQSLLTLCGLCRSDNRYLACHLSPLAVLATHYRKCAFYLCIEVEVMAGDARAAEVLQPLVDALGTID